jgi:hypothetical protein
MIHILCQRCGEWQGNVTQDGPIGWLELLDGSGWVWDHACGRITVRRGELETLVSKQRVRRYPTPIG